MKRGSVLLADRDVEMLEGMRILLESIYSNVVMVASSSALIYAARWLRPDLAIVGLSLKVRGDDVNVARFLRRECPDQKFLLLSGHHHPAVVKEALAAGASGFLLRQTVSSDLILAVREVRRDRLFISPIAETHLWAQAHLESSLQ